MTYGFSFSKFCMHLRIDLNDQTPFHGDQSTLLFTTLLEQYRKPIKVATAQLYCYNTSYANDIDKNDNLSQKIRYKYFSMNIQHDYKWIFSGKCPSVLACNRKESDAKL